MKVLGRVQPTAEQLTIIEDVRPGATVILGAAGSGKTTTALLRLAVTQKFWQRRLVDGYIEPPIRTLVLTYNRTLRGYIEALAREQISPTSTDIEITTFDKWARDRLGKPRIVPDHSKIMGLAMSLGLSTAFAANEVDYLLGKFLPEDLKGYLTVKREGRGTSPRMEQSMRRRLLKEVVGPYAEWKREKGLMDFNDLAMELANSPTDPAYHIVVADECQDFSANQIRALMEHTVEDATVTFVLDSAQQIYPRHFSWKEVDLSPTKIYRLGSNFRNTREIAAFAAPLLAHVPLSEQGSIPNLTSCKRSGPRPVVVQGRFEEQMNYVITAIESLGGVNDSVAVLHAKGGKWFRYVRERLTEAGIGYCDIAGTSEWPSGPEMVALSTMHSAKGLEFDHVFIVGLNEEVTPHGADEGDDQLENHLRLLAMAITRARESVMISCKPTEASKLIDHLDPSTYDRIGDGT